MLLALPGVLLAAKDSSTVRGKLGAGRKLGSVTLDGDEQVRLVLDDERLFGADIEIQGTPQADGKFLADPIHLKPVYIYRKGQRLGVSYWCGVCYIRTYAPGKCWCCQEYTELDPKDPNTPDRKP